MSGLPSTPEARALTDDALASLHLAHGDATSAKDFLALADAIVLNPVNQLALPDRLGPPVAISPDRDGVGIDAENAPRVHEYLGEMARANAADPRLWVYLAFVTYRDYMEERWPLGAVGTWENRVIDRWLLPRVTRGSLIRHGIARLWWIAHLTHQPQASPGLAESDPHGYTREALRTEDRVLGIFDREVGAMPDVVKAVLDHVARGDGRDSEGHIRGLMKELTLMHGYRDIGVLDADEIRFVIEDASATADVDVGLPSHEQDVNGS